MSRVNLYTRPGCHLCEPVKELILVVQRERGFDFSTVNIEEDAGTLEKYKHAIPVVVVDGREIARYKLRRSQLEDALGSERS